MADAGALTFQFRGDASDLSKQIKDLRKQLMDMGTSGQEVGKKIRDGLREGAKAADDFERSVARAARSGSLMGSFLGGLAQGSIKEFVSQLVQAVPEAIKQVSELGRTATLTGTSLLKMQEMQSAAANKGIGSTSFNQGMQKFGELLNDAKRDENDLSKLFDANNIKLTDRAGKQRTVNELFGQLGNLVRNAGSEFDKIKIAEMAGLTKEWVPFLEQGADAIARAGEEAGKSGGMISDDLVRKAQEFQNEWNRIIAEWSEAFQKAIVAIAQKLEQLWAVAKPLLDKLGEYMQGISLDSKMKQGLPLDQADVDFINRNGGAGTNNLLADAVADQRRRALAAYRYNEIQDSNYPDNGNNIVVGGKSTRIGPATIIPSKGGGSGGSSGPDIDAIQRYIIQLQRASDLAKVETETWGKGNLARQQAINQINLTATAERAGLTVTEEQRKKVDQITAAYVKQQEELEKLRQQQQDLKELASTFADAITGWVVDGRKFKDVLKDILKSLEQMLLKAALMGEGPLAGLLNLRGTGGNAGGILGGLFGMFNKGPAIGPGISGLFAGGGNVARGRAYVVGEKGPELFVPGASGAVMTGGLGADAGGHSFHFTYNIGGQVSKAELVAALKMSEGRVVPMIREAMARGRL